MTCISIGVAEHSQSAPNGVKRFQWDPRGKYKHSEAQMSDGMHSTTEEMRRGGIFSSHRGEFFLLPSASRAGRAEQRKVSGEYFDSRKIR